MNNVRDVLMKAACIVQAGLVIVINPIIVTLVLRSLYGKIGRRHPEARIIFIKILLIGIVFEIALTLRIVLLLHEDGWLTPDNDKSTSLFILAFTTYILFGEVACQVILISGIFIFTRKLRVRHLQGKKTDG